MTDYDFGTLDDKEFEIFSADLLGDLKGCRFERFKRGKDGGVDGRFFKATGEEVILQCKHRPASSIEQLIRHLAKDERPKLEKLKPKQYLLALSNTLSRADKLAIQRALEPHLTSPQDIFGREDLNDHLAKRPAIERRHYKLWLSSSTVLESMLNKAIFDRSSYTVGEILATSSRYVLTSSHQKALEMLERLHVIIVSGEPGAGKTTLAEHVCLEYVTAGYQLIKISEEVREAEAVYEQDQLQIFYFDDFLGRNYLEALSGHEGNQIVQFIRRVSKDPKKRFALTSRSTVLNQGKILIDNFRNQNLDKNEFELTVSSLSELDKAKILYSHIWRSGLQQDFIDEIYLGRRYRAIIAHKNYNPRLISFITDPDRLEYVSPVEFWPHVLKTLNDPADVWGSPFDAQLDDFGRALVLLVTLNRKPTYENELSLAYVRYLAMPQNHSMSGRREYLTTLRHLTGSLLVRKIVHGFPSPIIDLFNPSIADFVLRRYIGDTPSLQAAFLALRSSSSLGTLGSLRDNQFISTNAASELFLWLLQTAGDSSFVGFEPGYVAHLARTCCEGNPGSDIALKGKALSYLLLEEEIPFGVDMTKLMEWGYLYNICRGSQVEALIRELSENSPSQAEITALVSLTDAAEMDLAHVEEMRELLETAALTELENVIGSEIDANDVFENVDYEDFSTARNNVEDFARKWLKSAGIQSRTVDVEKIVDSIDLADMHESYFRPASSSHTPGLSSADRSSFLDEVEDLFERD